MGIVVVLSGASFCGLVLLLPPARVHALVQAQLKGTLARDVRYAGASVGLLPPVRLTVARPELAEPGGFGSGTAFRAASLHLDLDLFALLFGRTVVRRVILDGPQLHLVLAADGSTNLDGIARPTPARARPMDLEVRDLVVRTGSLVVDDLRASRRLACRIDTRLSFANRGTRLATSGHTEIRGVARGSLAARRLVDLDRSLAPLVFKLDHRGAYDSASRRLALERATLSLGRASIDLSGVVDDPGPRARLDLKTRGRALDLARLVDFANAADLKALRELGGSGQLSFNLAIRGPLGPGGPPRLVGRLTVADATLRYAGAPARLEGVRFGARFAPDSLTIPDFQARVVGAIGSRLTPLSGRLDVTHFADPVVSFGLRGDLDLAAIGPLVAPKDMRLTGRSALDLEGRGRAKDPGSIALSGRARLVGGTVESRQLPRKIEGLEAAFEFSPARAAVRGLKARAGRSSFAIDASVTRPLALLAKPGAGGPAAVEFQLDSPYLDLAELLPVAGGAPFVLQATGGGRASIARLKNGKLDVSNVRAQVILEPGVVSIPDFRCDGYQGVVAGAARFDLGDPKRPAMTLKAHVDSVQADALLSAWTPVKGLLRGSLDSRMDLALRGATPDEIKRSLTAVGLATFAHGSFGPGPVPDEIAKTTHIAPLRRLDFHNLKVPFRIERGRVVTDAVEMRGPYGDWKMSGAVGFDGALDYAVSVTLPREVAQRLETRSPLAAGALADEQGNLLLDLKVTGTGRAPRVAWDGQAMRDRVAGRASQALKAQHKRLEREVEDAVAARRRAAEDSARAAVGRARQGLADSLRRRAGGVLKGFFGGALGDSAR